MWLPGVLSTIQHESPVRPQDVCSMVEGLNAKTLLEMDRMDNLAVPGFILMSIGIGMPLLIELVNRFTQHFTLSQLNVFNGTFCVIMITGLFMLGYGITFRRRGDIVMPLALSFTVLFSVDLFSWVYFAIMHFVSGPQGIFIIPFVAPGQIPFVLTLLFIMAVMSARMTYLHDPRKSGKPLYFNEMKRH